MRKKAAIGVAAILVGMGVLFLGSEREVKAGYVGGKHVSESVCPAGTTESYVYGECCGCGKAKEVRKCVAGGREYFYWGDCVHQAESCRQGCGEGGGQPAAPQCTPNTEIKRCLRVEADENGNWVEISRWCNSDGQPYEKPGRVIGKVTDCPNPGCGGSCRRERGRGGRECAGENTECRRISELSFAEKACGVALESEGAVSPCGEGEVCVDLACLQEITEGRGELPLCGAEGGGGGECQVATGENCPAEYPQRCWSQAMGKALCCESRVESFRCPDEERGLVCRPEGEQGRRCRVALPPGKSHADYCGEGKVCVARECYEAECGNGVLDEGEVCDPANPCTQTVEIRELGEISSFGPGELAGCYRLELVVGSPEETRELWYAECKSNCSGYRLLPRACVERGGLPACPQGVACRFVANCEENCRAAYPYRCWWEREGASAVACCEAPSDLNDEEGRVEFECSGEYECVPKDEYRRGLGCVTVLPEGVEHEEVCPGGYCVSRECCEAQGGCITEEEEGEVVGEGRVTGLVEPGGECSRTEECRDAAVGEPVVFDEQKKVVECPGEGKNVCVYGYCRTVRCNRGVGEGAGMSETEVYHCRPGLYEGFSCSEEPSGSSGLWWWLRKRLLGWVRKWWPKAAWAEGKVRVVFRDKETGEEWEFGVEDDGRFHFSVPLGRVYEVKVRAEGYEETVGEWRPEEEAKYWAEIRLGRGKELRVEKREGEVGYRLEKGWNMVGLAVQPSGWTIKDLMDEVNREGGEVMIANRWVKDHWEPYILNVSQQPFEIRSGEGYALLAGRESRFSLKGEEVREVEYRWEKGWQLAGLPLEEKRTAGEMLEEWGGRVKMVARWDRETAMWQARMEGGAGGEFGIRRTEGYMIRVKEGFEWVSRKD